MMWAREPCAAMSQMNLVVDGIPERWHPKSFRSVINFNTNLWASRDPKHIATLKGPPVGVFPANQSVTDSWFGPAGSDLAAGGRSCELLRESVRAEKMEEAARATLLVSHHCRCEAAWPCAKAEAVADECAKKGEVPFED
jgi:hypothetical protein